MLFTYQVFCRRQCGEKQKATGAQGDLDSSRRAATNSLDDLRQTLPLLGPRFPHSSRKGLQKIISLHRGSFGIQ